MTEFHIFYDADYLAKPRRDFKAILAGAPPFPHEKCYFDDNMPYSYGGFYVATIEDSRVCTSCIIEQDPQILNIMRFITASDSLTSQLKKFEIGIEQLRKQIAVSDPAARKCPLCNARKVYKESVAGKYGFKCLNCQICYIGGGQFYFEGKIYTINQAKKIVKMKAFA